MLKPVQFVKPCVINGPLYQVGEVAGFMPEFAAQLIAEGKAKEYSPGPAPEPAAADPSTEVSASVSGFPEATADERQARRAGPGGKKPGGKRS